MGCLTIPKKYQEQDELLLAQNLVKTLHIITDGDSGQMYRYNEGVYRPITKNILNMLIVEEFINEELNYNRNRKQITIDFIKSFSFRGSKQLQKQDQNVINLQNGFYYLDKTVSQFCVNNETKETWYEDSHFKHHDKGSSQISFVQIPVEYHPAAVCPIIDSFLEDVFGIDKVDSILEFIGYLLLPHVDYQRAMILIGAGKNGKSTFLEMLISFLGVDNIKQIPLQDLSKPFKLYNLKNIMANIVADIPQREIKDTGNAKRIVTDNTLSGDIKNIQGDFNFGNRCKMLYSCNILPKSKDTTSAFYRRWLPYICSTSFEGRVDVNMLKKITSEVELSGLFNRALEGIERLTKRGGFPDTELEVKTLWEMESNPLASFIAKRCDRIYGEEIKSVDLFTAFNTFRAERKEYLLDGKQIGYWLRQLGIVGITKKSPNDVDEWGKTKRYVFYQGISFKAPVLYAKKSMLDTFGREI